MFTLYLEPPLAPTEITLSQINTNSLLISWSMSDCAVQYEITIIDSADDSDFLKLITGATNAITVTFPTVADLAKFCVTVIGIDSFGRNGLPSEMECLVEGVFMDMTLNLLSG